MATSGTGLMVTKGFPRVNTRTLIKDTVAGRMMVQTHNHRCDLLCALVKPGPLASYDSSDH